MCAETCRIMHYPCNDPENGPARPCILPKGHDGYHEQALIEPELCEDPNCKCDICREDREYQEWLKETYGEDFYNICFGEEDDPELEGWEKPDDVG